MKWYFASRTRHRERIKEISGFLSKKGEAVLSDWVHEDSLRPYGENLDKVHSLSKRVVGSILDADIFVLISDPEGTDMFVELGIALGNKAVQNGIRIYIVGEHARRSLMQLHPSIIHTDTIGDVFRREGISTDSFNVPRFE
jgi:hypothetical protein